MNPRERNDLSAFFEPCAVAAFGSLREVPGTAFWVIRNMQHFGFTGPIYPINPDPARYGEVLGCRVYASVREIHDPIDLAVIITPPPTVPGIAEACARKGIRAVVVLSEGFSESGGEGENLQEQLSDISRRTGTRIMGPNTFGVFNSANGLATLPPFTDQERFEPGEIALCSQTGSIGPHQNPLGDWAYPVGKVCDIGNKCDVDESDVLHYLADDLATKVVAMHLEDVRDGPRFMDAARKLVSRKPLVVLKAGRSKAGAKASISHTGSLMGKDPVYDAALRQTGALRVRTWQELWEVPKTLLYQPLPRGNRFAAITVTGGQGVIAADSAADAGLELAEFTPETVESLTKIFPRLGGNPVDTGPAMSDSRSQSSSNPFAVLGEALSVVLRDANVDCATITCYAGQQILSLYPMVVDMLEHSIQETEKALTVWIYGTSLSAMQELSRQLQARKIPAFTDMDIAIRSLACASRYRRTLLHLEGRQASA